MNTETMNEELMTASMNIILNAGDARNLLAEALKDAKAFDFTAADNKLKEAKKLATLGHKNQTKIIQSEASGKKYPHSLLFTHAQDHLMTINSEMNFTSELIDVLKLINQKLK
ncbi:PTS lactose/cellobiose transporter subunit IIA [Jeotgalibaca sp. MA1X17-3]|uniref:PTS lactose/cellobiose transporter subunit IIA n=1 Tax=Jeotgalibaca sp. MA1X17-3 TaxID=2908211 RepID=UPI001F2A8A97|nr:PTS lactose/cellobiose transporter subunit IIA [Jeotgalibaca sp. MA1X17-3]UJF15562.1 PTS lactose/cellobiose transporter subunit IIA [Jeotgalibaca sp. MA1X17-3]